jgi:hypothetical protein
MRECLALLKHGVPFDVAFALDNNTRTAWLVMIGENEGGVFNWNTGQWEKPKSG